MRSTSTYMSPEHDSSSLNPTSITIVDDTTTTTTTPPEDYYTPFAKQPHHHFSSHSPPDPITSTNYYNYYPSSPETRISMSGSSTGSYSIPPQRNGNWDSALAMSSPPLSPPAAVLDPHIEASRIEAGLISPDTYKKGKWSAEVSLSDGGHGHGRNSSRSVVHDAPNTVTVYTTTSDDKEGDRNREPNAVLVLLLLSGPIPFFSLCTSIYTFFAVLLVIFSSPLRLCPPTSFFRSTTFSTQLCKLLAPALRKHDRLAQSSSSQDYYYPHYDNSSSNSTDPFSASGLILVLSLAPFLCMGLWLAVWIAAFFWIFAMILGNPDGTEKKDDGRAAVLGVNRWWQTWLRKSRKSQ
ncbi:conserved hypothetical protein [Talaromyces stipitatus ATCC 10500]|uniref:Uncharacterized protein n=1 Tax=Talaromyces stipitatus (strain ATCC 10500 / CBS 375.48 / QM 6759 / NRRL 1006) TaxID=441959 RepID=B8MLK8_TALSN|nr:uncharacterized protein TSTA_049790 [Talaromyces stipitatus ATCC 10500]EED15541.1 conserved hypothetical protein [Talaromyces stipitatus ATCC 10500]